MNSIVKSPEVRCNGSNQQFVLHLTPSISRVPRCQADLESRDQLGWTALLHACRNDMAEAPWGPGPSFAGDGPGDASVNPSTPAAKRWPVMGIEMA